MGPEDHTPLLKALASEPRRASFIRDYSIEYDDWGEYFEYACGPGQPYNRRTKQLEYDDAEVLSSLTNLRRLKIWSPWFDEKRVKSFTALFQPPLQAFRHLTSCE